MAKAKTYSTANSFRTALEERLKSIAKEGLGLDRLRKQVSFDRLLARLFSSPMQWVLKGGYAMQLRLEGARNTKDVDLALKELRLHAKNEEERHDALQLIIQEYADKDLDDFFRFLITGPIKDLNAAPYGGARYLVETRLAGRLFEKFHLDIGIGDVWIEPLESLVSLPWLEFAGISRQRFPAIPVEQQFAEKLHAYTRPRENANSRVKDLVDMSLLIGEGKMDLRKLGSAVRATFERYKTHNLPTHLDPPPESWFTPFSKLAEECHLGQNLDDGFRTVEHFFKTIPLLTLSTKNGGTIA